MPKERLIVTAAEIRQRFASTRVPADPAMAALPAGADQWPQSMLERMAGGLTPAGVLIPIIERPAELTVLLTERSPDLKHHAGQVSFPGGRMEVPDADIGTTALRETQEEVGIHPRQVDIAGYLEPTATVTGYAVTPVIGFVSPDVELTIDPIEVKSVFEVPLNYLLDEANQEHSQRHFDGASIPVISFYYESQRIWGATAGVLVALREFLLEK